MSLISVWEKFWMDVAAEKWKFEKKLLISVWEWVWVDVEVKI